jgi:protein SCO1/2
VQRETGDPARSKVDGNFRLVDHHGATVSNRSYDGKLLLVLFGFTNCRAVCPRKLAEIDAVLDRLSELADRVQPLYVTVDPERDTPDVMRTFLRVHPRFIGLTGDRAQIDEVKLRFRVFARRVEDASDPGNYNVPHTAVTYLMNADGGYLAHFLDGTDVEQMVSRIRELWPGDPIRACTHKSA